MFKNLILSISTVLIFVSCSQKAFDTKEELVAYIMNVENGYTQRKSINGVDFSITYRPTDLLVQQEISSETSERQVDSLRNKYGKYMYFNLSLSKNNQEVLNSVSNSRADFSTMVNQLAFGMGDKIHLVSKRRDTIELADYVYPRLFGIGSSTSMLFVYPRNNKLLKDDVLNFSIEEIGLRTGEVRFKMLTESIKNEPKLKFCVNP